MKKELLKLGFVLEKIDEYEECFELNLPNGGCVVISSNGDTDNEDIDITLKNDSGYEFIFKH